MLQQKLEKCGKFQSGVFERSSTSLSASYCPCSNFNIEFTINLCLQKLLFFILFAFYNMLLADWDTKNTLKDGVRQLPD